MTSSNAPISEIKVVSSHLRKQLNRHLPVNHNSNIANHDRFISKHFWKYVKCYLQSTQSLLPSFHVTRCTEHFCKAALNSNNLFPIPSWIPQFSEPAYPFDMKPPSYQTITSIIRRMTALLPHVHLTRYRSSVVSVVHIYDPFSLKSSVLFGFLVEFLGNGKKQQQYLSIRKALWTTQQMSDQ